MEKNEKYREIFLTSHELFLSQGYEAATIRQISDLAGVSLGLTNHFFQSKQILAGRILDMLSVYSTYHCDRNQPDTDPLLRSVLRTRVTVLYLLRGRYSRFYLESLKHDIRFPMLHEKPDPSLAELARIHGFPVDEDLFLFYGTYMPWTCEKTLILGKEKGLFSTIHHDEIPDYIAISRFEHFLDSRLLEQALSRSRQAAQTVLSRMPSVVPDEFLLQYLEPPEED